MELKTCTLYSRLLNRISFKIAKKNSGHDEGKGIYFVRCWKISLHIFKRGYSNPLLWEIIETPQFSSYKYVVLFLCGVDRFTNAYNTFLQRVSLIYDACSFS